MTDHTYLSAVEQASLVRDGSIRAINLVQLCIDRINNLDGKINAVVTRCFERALNEAEILDQERSRGKFRGPLHGVPITIKDSLDTGDIVSTGGTMGRRKFLPKQDAPVVRRLRQAGAIILGKTNTPELTLSGETNNLIFGRTNNPYDLSRSPGGSSGGSVAAIASGYCALELGSDTGGSIREPAHYCGVSGLKPTFGRVPRSGHIVPHGLGHLDRLTQIGPIARCVDDIALAYRLITGPDFEDPTVVPMPAFSHEEVTLRKLRIAYYTDNGVIAPDPAIEKQIIAAAGRLKTLTDSVTPACPSNIPGACATYEQLRTADGGNTVRRLLARYGTKRYSEDLEYCLSSAAVPSARQFSQILEEVDRTKSELLGFFRKYDVIVCPPSATLARKHGESLNDTMSMWSHNTVYNMTGWPSIVIQSGMSDEGLPVGVQIIAAPWREDRVLAVARALERSFIPPDL